MNKKELSKHHPFCQALIKNSMKFGIAWIGWNCVCNVLKAYDKWRRNK